MHLQVSVGIWCCVGMCVREKFRSHQISVLAVEMLYLMGYNPGPPSIPIHTPLNKIQVVDSVSGSNQKTEIISLSEGEFGCRVRATQDRRTEIYRFPDSVLELCNSASGLLHIILLS